MFCYHFHVIIGLFTGILKFFHEEIKKKNILQNISKNYLEENF